VEDSPFDLSGLGSTMFIEDVEDGTIDTPLAIVDTIVREPGPLTDSVDADDGVVDGQGNDGHSLEATFYRTHPTFPWTHHTYFSILVVDEPVTALGFVWTDGFRQSAVNMGIYGASGNYLGDCTYGSLMDSFNTGETAEDRFIGVISNESIRRLSFVIDSVGLEPWSERFEFDHVHYGHQALPEPGFVLNTILSLTGLGVLRHRWLSSNRDRL
jgi:hypothetical protein